MRKSELTRKKLTEGLLKVLGEHGVDGITFKKVAETCDVSQALVVKTFLTREGLIWSGYKFLLEEARQITLESMTPEISNTAKLAKYFEVSIKVFLARPETPKLYLNLYYLSGFDSRYRDFNSQLKKVAVERVKAILDLGIAEGEFKAVRSTELMAKAIHSSLSGILLNSVTETSSYEIYDLAQALLNQVLSELSAREGTLQ